MTISSERNKTIAFVSNSAWSVYNFRLDVIRHLRSRGYHIIIIAPDDEYSSFLVELGGGHYLFFKTLTANFPALRTRYYILVFLFPPALFWLSGCGRANVLSADWGNTVAKLRIVGCKVSRSNDVPCNRMNSACRLTTVAAKL